MLTNAIRQTGTHPPPRIHIVVLLRQSGEVIENLIPSGRGTTSECKRVLKDPKAMLAASCLRCKGKSNSNILEFFEHNSCMLITASPLQEFALVEGGGWARLNRFYDPDESVTGLHVEPFATRL